MSLSGNRWLDYKILNKLSDLELAQTFEANENLRFYQDDDDFWGDRIAKKYPYLVKPKNMTNREFWQSLRPIMLALYQDNTYIICPPIVVSQEYLNQLEQEVNAIKNPGPYDYGIVLYTSLDELVDLVTYEFDDDEVYELEKVEKVILETFFQLSDEEIGDLFLETYVGENFCLGLEKIPPYINGLLVWQKYKQGLLVPV